MSSKISPIYPLTVYPTGNIMAVWPGLCSKVFSANDADTLGFHVRIMTKSRECVQSVSHLIGINPVSQTAKRKNGDKLVRCFNKAASQVQQKALEFKRSYAVEWYGRRDSNSQGRSPYHRHPTRVTVWRVNQFRHVRVCVTKSAALLQTEPLVRSKRGAYNTTMTVIESSEQSTMTITVCVRLIRITAPPFWGFPETTIPGRYNGP